ncbi:hypothetical protein [Pseudomonas asplenii]|uniref:hypothetical protein n=1 Tax=Pseudomonas asplenii TaxID=53407 RepID=UPI00128F5098|nr:hypothetical protein [Pseudomonas fuscovaginae]
MKCDLFLSGEYSGGEFKFLRIFDRGFVCELGRVYSGYLGLNVERVKMVSILLELKRNGVDAFSLPIRYRDLNGVSFEESKEVASNYAESKGFGVFFDYSCSEKMPPAFWAFRLSGGIERVGGFVMVDRLDGHVWSDLEYDEYMYDFNNVL